MKVALFMILYIHLSCTIIQVLQFPLTFNVEKNVLSLSNCITLLVDNVILHNSIQTNLQWNCILWLNNDLFCQCKVVRPCHSAWSKLKQALQSLGLP
jgi:hypothetical protein